MMLNMHEGQFVICKILPCFFKTNILKYNIVWLVSLMPLVALNRISFYYLLLYLPSCFASIFRLDEVLSRFDLPTNEICLLLQIVFRSNPGKFVKLKYECEEFLKLVGTTNDLIKGVGRVDKQHISDQVYNWQVKNLLFSHQQLLLFFLLLRYVIIFLIS